MKPPTFLPLFFFFFFFFPLSFSLNSDGLSLLALKSAINNDPTRSLTTWSESDPDPCNWVGIQCTHGQVTHLSLPNKSLTGYIPSELGALLSLRHLSLSYNNFSRPIPAHLFNATSLISLDLSHNSLSGPIPAQIASLKNLQILDLSSNLLNGSLPVQLAELTELMGDPSNALPPLSWASRLKIAQGIARGLMHIHECSLRKYVHGNFKSSKVLLDEDFHPYISGFGLNRLVSGSLKSANPMSRRPSLNQPVLMGSKILAPSSVVYMAPEVQSGVGKLTQKCDVYSFGVVLMEILTGRVPDAGPHNDGKGLDNLVRKVFREERPLSEIIDPALLHEVHAKKQVLATFHIALNCTELDPELRPRMKTVSESLDRLKFQ